MTKAQLVEEMAQGAGITKAEAGRALDALLDCIGKTLKGKNARVALPGFGSFSTVHRKARKGVNPATGERITIKARNAVKFTPGKALKDAMS